MIMFMIMIMEGPVEGVGKAKETEPKKAADSTRHASAKTKSSRSKLPTTPMRRKVMPARKLAHAKIAGQAGTSQARRSKSEPPQDARITFVISGAAKKRIYGRAKREGGSVADYIRSAIDGYDPSAAEEEAQLRALLEVFNVTHRETLEALDSTEAKLDNLIAKLDAASR